MTTESDAQNHTPLPCLVSGKITHLQDYLRGYGRPDGERLLPLIAFDDWPGAARSLLAARCTRILETLDDDSLLLISEGHISVPDVVAGVAMELGAL